MSGLGTLKPSGSDANPRGCVKGVVLKSRLMYITKYGDAGAMDRVLALLSEADRETLTGIVLAVSWYPFELNANLDRAMGTVLGGGRGILRKMGSQSALDSLGSTHKNLIRARDPHGLLKHSAQIHNLYYDTGYRVYQAEGPTGARLQTFECKSFSEEDCLTNIGWHETAIGMCGGSNVKVVHTLCRTRGDNCCEHFCTWE